MRRRVQGFPEETASTKLIFDYRKYFDRFLNSLFRCCFSKHSWCLCERGWLSWNWGCHSVLHQTDLDFHSVLRILDVLQCCINVERHHQARCEPQRVVRLPGRLYDCCRRPMDLWTGRETKKVVCLPPGSSLLLGIHKHSSVFLQISFMIWATTCSGSLSCSRPLCLSVVWRILTSSTGLQEDRRGISSKSLSTKLSWRWGSSVRNNLRGQKTGQKESVFISVMKAANGNRSQQRHLECSGDFPSVPPKSIIVASLIERCFTNKLALWVLSRWVMFCLYKIVVASFDPQMKAWLSKQFFERSHLWKDSMSCRNFSQLLMRGSNLKRRDEHQHTDVVRMKA